MQPTATPPAIQAVDLVKTYGKGGSKTYALRKVNFSVSKGDFVSIIGPSGSGKSTLLNMIGALDRPTSGKVFLDGIDISKLPSNALAKIRNKKIGFVFQSFNLLDRISVKENVELPLSIAGVSEKQRQKISTRLLEQFGISSKAHSKPNLLSGGEQQRAAVARSLANNPSMILADEPTGNLDTTNTEIVMKILENLHEETGKTVVIITHNIELAKRTRSSIVIRDGQIDEVRENWDGQNDEVKDN
ncbi:MAG: ABC transporter ATP-binding protein [Nitrososphaerota archaeon]|nr:ABC transporter ATP-binding protein [Nitrososphaerota archaeon]